MIPAAVPILLEAAARALVAALVLWAGLRLLRVRNVPAQKTAWGLVLAVALAMPLLMRMPLPGWAQVRVPALALPALHGATPAATQSVSPQSVAPQSDALPSAPAASASLDATPVSSLKASTRTSAPPVSAYEFDASVDAKAVAPADEQPVAQPASQFATQPAAPIVTRSFLMSTVMGAFGPAVDSALNSALQPARLLASLWLLYLAVGAALLLRLLFGLVSSFRLWTSALPVQIPAEAAHDPLIPVRASRRVASPVNIGSGIVLPADYAAWDQEKLRVVLAHERSHVHQRDFYLQLFSRLYASLIWFSPLGWWLKRKLSELGEAISDRAGLEAADSPSAYAELLLEFAVLPRPPITGVAMAHTNNLSARIERLLNDATFRQSFTGRRRALVALLLVPIAILASTALVRVQAARVVTGASMFQIAPQSQDQQSPPPQSSAQTSNAQSTNSQSGDSQSGNSQSTSADSSASGQSSAGQANGSSSDQAPSPAPQAAPAPEGAPPADVAPAAGIAPTAPSSPDAPPAPIFLTTPGKDSMPIVIAVPPMPQVAPLPSMSVVTPMELNSLSDDVMSFDFSGLNDKVMKLSKINGMGMNELNGLLYLDAGGLDGDAAALVGDPGTTPRFIGTWDGDYADEIDKARKQAHGHFFWFRHDGKSYIIDDPSLVSQLETMQSHLEDLRKQMRDLREQERGLGEQEREQARKQREATQSLPKPDLSDAVAQLNAAVAALKSSQGDTVSREQLAEIQRRLGEIQSKLMASEVKVNWSAYSGDWSKWSQAMSEYGAKMGALGSQMGAAARENHEKIRSIIDESLKNGKAQPVN
jgi:beta-lactamase regulating signal transducer with metallopeptidase domain